MGRYYQGSSVKAKSTSGSQVCLEKSARLMVWGHLESVGGTPRSPKKALTLRGKENQANKFARSSSSDPEGKGILRSTRSRSLRFVFPYQPSTDSCLSNKEKGGIPPKTEKVFCWFFFFLTKNSRKTLGQKIPLLGYVVCTQRNVTRTPGTSGSKLAQLLTPPLSHLGNTQQPSCCREH